MENIFVEFLPPWIETGLQPAFYDKESGTVLQQTARMYSRVNMLIRMFNKLSKNTKTTVEDYINQFNELHDYVHDYFDNLDVQEEIDNKLDEMAEDGTLKVIFQDYLSGEISALNNKLDTAIDRQDTYITETLENTKSGAPIPVSSTSQMTDTSRIYLNTTDGKWYYYNGNSWTVGGTYQATNVARGSVDGFELTSQAKVDLFTPVTESSITWGCEGLYQGNPVSSQDAIDSTQFVLFDAGDVITLVDSENYRIRVAQYNRTTKSYVSTTSMLTDSYTIPAKNLYRIQVSSNDNTRPMVANISSIISFNGLIEKNIKPVDYGELSFVNKTSIPYSDIENGTINDSGNPAPQGDRIRSADFIIAKKGKIFNLRGDTGLYFIIKKYDAEKNFIGNATSGWLINGQNHYFKIDFDGYFKFILKQSQNGTIQEADLPNYTNLVEVYDTLPDSLGFTMDNDIDLSDVTMRNSNNLSISAHRGQFDNQYPENTIVAYTVAVGLQFDYIETDVRFTSDGYAVICHDETINRVARYQDGTQLQSPVYVDQSTYNYLSQFDYGIYKGATYAGTPLLTFDDVCKFAKFYNVRINIDYKGGDDSNALSAVNTVKKYGLTRFVKWTCDASNARRILAILPNATVRIGAWNPSTATVNAVLTLQNDYPDAEIGIDIYVGNTTPEIFASIQNNALICSCYCGNNTHITQAVLNGAEELTVNNTLPYNTIKDYYDNNY